MLNLAGFGFTSRFGAEVSAIARQSAAGECFLQWQVDFIHTPATAVRRRRAAFHCATVVVQQHHFVVRAHHIRAGPATVANRRLASADFCRASRRTVSLATNTCLRNTSHTIYTTRPTALSGGSFAVHCAFFHSLTC